MKKIYNQTILLIHSFTNADILTSSIFNGPTEGSKNAFSALETSFVTW